MRVEWTGQHAKDDLKAIHEGGIKRAYMGVLRSFVTDRHWGTDEGRCRFFEFYICFCKQKRAQKGFVAKTLASAALDSVTGILAPATGVFEMAAPLHSSHGAAMKGGYVAGLAHAASADESEWARVMLGSGQVSRFFAIAYEELLHPECVKVYVRAYDPRAKSYYLGLIDSAPTYRQDVLYGGIVFTKFIRSSKLVRVRR